MPDPGTRLRTLRLAHGWSLDEAARQSAVPWWEIANCEAGQPRFPDSVALLCIVYGVTLDEGPRWREEKSRGETNIVP